MKALFSRVKRGLAWVLTLCLLMSGADLGLVSQALAGETDTASKTVAQVVAENYDLTDAEKALLESGLLASGRIDYTVPTNNDGLVEVDTDNKMVTAKAYKDWTATKAEIVVGGDAVAEIDMESGVGAYNYDGNAFSVKVTYEKYYTPADGEQKELLDNAAALKQGVANTDAVSAQSGNLYTLEEAMPKLMELANMVISIGSSGATAGLSDEGKAAIRTLNAQMEANGGKLKLSSMVQEYDAGSKTDYLLTKGAAMQDEVEELLGNLGVIASALKLLGNNVDVFIQYGIVDAATGEKIKLAAGIVGSLNNGLADVAADPWTAANTGVAMLQEGEEADFSDLDSKIAELGEITSVREYKTSLLADSAEVTCNLSMVDVEVTVELKVVEMEDFGEYSLKTAGSRTAVVTVAEGAAATEVLAEIEKNGVEAEAIAAWGDAYVEGQYEATNTGLPETLNEDTTYTITYEPKMYTVTIAAGAGLVYEELVVPYGYEFFLWTHNDPNKAYDYTVGGEAMAQGGTFVVTKDMEVSRKEGKSYTAGDLYSIVADNYGNDVTKAILTSGALNGNEDVRYRKPDPADAESVLTLENGVLTAENYASDYNGLEWVPYTYGETGTENEFNGSTADWTGKSAKVQYILELTNFGKAKSEEVLALAEDLKEEAKAQKSTLDAFAENYDAMGQLDKTKLGALNGVIGVTDFTPGDGTETDEENLRLRAYFSATVSAIIASNVDSNNYLKIYNMLTEYKKDGLSYYYKNSAAVRGEIDSLSGYLNDLLDEEEALRIMVKAAGYPEYADKISDLGEKMDKVEQSLTEPNAMIDLTSGRLSTLVNVLTAAGEAGTKEGIPVAAPYVTSETLMITDSSQVYVQVMIVTTKGGAAVQTDAMDRGTVLTQAVVDDLEAEVAAEVAGRLGGNAGYYDLTTGGSLDVLVGTPIESIQTVTYTYTPKTYQVIIEGGEIQDVTIEDLIISLPRHSDPAWTYYYTVDGVAEITASSYAFTPEQLDRLFEDGVYTITREEKNDAYEKFEGTFGDWIVYDADQNAIGLNAKVAGDKDGIEGFAMKLVNSGYTYIALNGEPLMYMNDEDTLEICLQTLINAVLKDATFGSQTLIDLGKSGKGELVHAKMDLGNDAEHPIYEDLEFTMTLTSVPGQMGTVANGLEKIEPYMTFRSDNGVMSVELDLPEKVYEACLTALLATGNVDLSDMNAVNSEIAFQLLWDYVNDIISDDAITTQTFTNTLDKLGQDFDLTGYEEYYQLTKKFLNNEGIEIDPEDDNDLVDLAVTAKGQEAINGLINFLGIDVSAYSTYLGMIKEYKDAEATITASAKAALVNTAEDFEALVIDTAALKAEGIENKAKAYDMVKTGELAGRMAAVSGYSAVVLLDDVTVDTLTFPAAAILDLNGKTLDGNVHSDATLIIIDSTMSTFTEGTITGTITGDKVTVLGGKYDRDVTGFLADGYIQDNGTVRNEMYTLVEDVNGSITVAVVPNGVTTGMPNMKALAVDLAADLALNYFTAASLNVAGYDIYSVDFPNLLTQYGYYQDGEMAELINDVLAVLNVDGGNGSVDTYDDAGIEGFVNQVLADALTFADEYTYSMTIEPWALNIERVEDGDYLTAGIVPNDEMPETVDVRIVFGDEIAETIGAMGAVVDKTASEARVSLGDLTYADKLVTVKGKAYANITLDLTSDDSYPIIIAAVLGYGNEELRADLTEAVAYYYANNNDTSEIKAVFDEVTLNQFFTSFKEMNRNTSFAEMAKTIGLTADDEVKELEQPFHLLMIGVGKVLEVLEIDGDGTKLGSAESKTEYGTYATTISPERSGEITHSSGYGVAYDLTVEDSTLTVKIFTKGTPGPGEEHVHDWDTAWSTNATHHWHECKADGCDVKTDAEKKDYGTHVDKDDNRYCDMCGYDMTDNDDDDDDDYTGGGGRVCCHSYHCPTSWYTDLKTSAWYHAYTDFVICNKLMIGVADELFDPDGVSTRAMIVTTIYRMAGSPAVTGTSGYTDVADGLWYSDAITWAAQNGIVNGYGNGTFGPNDAVTREQIATIFYRYAGFKGINTNRSADLSKYTDGAEVASWAKDAMEWAVATDMIKGTSTTAKVLSPHADTTRVTLATLLDRWVGKFGK